MSSTKGPALGQVPSKDVAWDWGSWFPPNLEVQNVSLRGKKQIYADGKTS